MSTNTRPQEGVVEARSNNVQASDKKTQMSVTAATGVHTNMNVTDTEKHTNSLESMNVTDTEKRTNSLESMLEDIPKYMCNTGHPGRISRIPENIREVDIKSYEPCYLSIGPYHHGKACIKSGEKTKWVVLKGFLERNPAVKLKDILKEIRSIEPEARSFYSDIQMENKKFVQMLLLDSIYLVIVFCGMPESRGLMNRTNSENCRHIDYEVNKLIEDFGSLDGSEESRMMDADQASNLTGLAWFWALLAHDLFLLENQIPFFVLQKMHDLVYGDSGTPLLDTLKVKFQDLLFGYIKLDSEMVILATEDIHHLLHLCHMFFRPTLQQGLPSCHRPESSQMFRLGNAMQLYESGVSFKAKSCSTPYSLLDVTFNSSRKLVMSCLNVDDNTNSLLRNLIALEQMKYPSLGLDISAYAVLLLHLVTIPEDVKLLRKKGIIQHHLASDKEMVYLINRLSVGLAFDYVEDDYYLKPVFHQLKRLSNNRVPRWRAWIKHRYFNNPWMTISLMAASLLLLLTGVQTYYAVYSYYHPYFDGQS